MADAAVKFVIQKLSFLLQQEASLLGGLYNEVDQIKSELVSMRSFLKDADRRQHSDEVVRAWVEQVRDAAYDIEDAIDEFLYCVDRPKRGGVMGVFHNTLQFSKSLIARHKIAIQLQTIKSNVIEISVRRQRYGIDRIEEGTSSTGAGGERWQHYKGPYASVDEANIVGIHKKKDLVVSWLMEDQPCRMVISVVGIGGLGKTTLVSKVYNAQIVKSHFDCLTWVSVSQSYQIEDLQGRIIRELFNFRNEDEPKDLSTKNYDQLLEMLKSYLQDKRYVIVLDDVWDDVVWSKLNDAFPDCKNGSRIIITSRNKNMVPRQGVLSRIYDLEPLQENEEAWSLFCKKAFWDDPQHSCPRELELPARKIVKKCEGLPLAIVAIGGLMSFRAKEEAEWENFYKCLSWELDNTHMLESVKGILFLSFNELPYHLKHCFLYCSVFPEDFLIPRGRLIRLWIAEGFVYERIGMTLEEVADDYLNELIFRSMLQVAETNAVPWSQTCRMHDLMRELALLMSKKENFCSIYDGGKEARQERKARRLLIHKSSENNEYGTSMSHLRSFFMFSTVKIDSSSLHTLLSSFKLLKILDLEGASIDSVPKELTNLFHLRYLSFKETEIRELPKSLGRLENLQHLDVWRTNIEKLPSGIIKLQNLRHLFMSGPIEKYGRLFHLRTGIKAPMGIWKLRNLQSLTTIEARREMVSQVEKMAHLRRLGISKVRAVEGEELCSFIQKLSCLNSLFLSARNEEESLKLETLSPPPLLIYLCLVGYLEQAPNWFSSLRSLTQLHLHWSRLRKDPLSSLHALPNLRSLTLNNAYEGQQLWFQAGWFPALEKLWLRDMKQLNVVRIEEGALPSIEEIYLRGCRELKVLPRGMEYLTSLQLLFLREMSEELVQKLRGGDGSEYHPKVRHIPKIMII